MATNSIKTTPSKSIKTIKISSMVRVIVRVRPFLDHEICSQKPNPLPCASLLGTPFDSTDDEVTIHLKDQETSRNEWYKLDGYFEEEDRIVEKIFEEEVKGLLPGLFQGCNATVFAFGATGSGKTYTMQGTGQNPGLISLAMSTILPICQANGSIAEISYYEVYLDRCYDLLELKPKAIPVLDDGEGQTHLRGLSRVLVKSVSEFFEVFTRGVQMRKIGHTGLNDVSSRSHAVLVIYVSATSDSGLVGSIIGKLNLVDLAGNEDNKRSHNEGIRLQESAKINQSLFALWNVIYALNNNKPWVPYRESKLTRILQDSLGGTSRGLMVACLNPGNYQEAVHTVSLAARSRHISNVVPSAQKQETMKAKIDMEAKLQAWLESKGKPKSARRKEAFGSPFFLSTPGHGSSMKKHVLPHSSVKDKTGKHGNSILKDSCFVPPRKLFDGEASYNGKNVKEPTLKDTDVECIVGGTKFDATVHLLDDFIEEDKQETNQANGFTDSPANRTKIISCQSPPRKALSPLNSNVEAIHIDEFSSRDKVLSVLLETMPNTPLGKFNACSTNLKSHLVQEYINFLNSATRDELIELKGIGMKRAEYIMELRETSPLKSLSDLEKIGLSSKQVEQLFRQAAKGIF